MQLFYAQTSPYSRKVLICAHMLDALADIELRPTSASPVAFNDVLGTSNPLGKIPVALVPAENLTLHDSNVICEYLDSRYGPLLYPRGGSARWQALTRQALANGILDAALLIRYEYALRPAVKRWDDWTLGQRQKIVSALRAMETQALSANAPSIGEVSLACALAYLDFRFPDFDWHTGHPRTAAWYASMAELPAMASTRPN